MQKSLKELSLIDWGIWYRTASNYLQINTSLCFHGDYRNYNKDSAVRSWVTHTGMANKSTEAVGGSQASQLSANV